MESTTQHSTRPSDHQPGHHRVITESSIGFSDDLYEERLISAVPIENAITTLQMAMITIPVVAGIDKFTYFLTDWTQYLAPVFPKALGMTSTGFLYGVGFLEMILGIGIAFKPRVFGYVLAMWFVAIMVNIFVLGKFFDIPLRDFGLAAAAFALASLTKAKEAGWVSNEDSSFHSPVIH